MLDKKISKVLYHINQEKSISRREQSTVLCVTEGSNREHGSQWSI